jgi:Nucleotidyl transferase AbiEii toxin, Type IV TA system
MPNSRMKDFYDIWMLARQFEFDSINLAEAIRKTFTQRQTDVPVSVVALSEAFGQTKQVQWNAFRKRLGQDHVPIAFDDVLLVLRMFLEPVLQSVQSESSSFLIWVAGGPWRDTQ